VFPSRIQGGSNWPLAQSIPQEGLLNGVTAEYERLAQRPPTAAESAVVRHLAHGCSVWATGIRPEALAHLALSLTGGAQQGVLFVSPAEDLLDHRQLRLSRRGSCLPLREAARSPSGDRATTAWATPDLLEPVLLARAFGSQGPAVIFVEEAETATPQSHAFRPSFAELKDILARFPDALLVCSSSSSSEGLRKSVGKVLGKKCFDKANVAPRGKSAALVAESTLSESSRLSLRIERDETASSCDLISPLPRPALVLCSTPAQADQVFLELEAEQVPVHRYHSALSASERARQLVHFALPGRRAVMVAVSAFGPEAGFAGGAGSSVPETFGRGYAREDLRTVVHLCAPCSLAQYASELALLAPATKDDSGDTTDDDAQNVALMQFSPAHLALNLALLSRKRPAPETLEAVVDVLRSNSGSTWIEDKEFDGTCGSRRDLEVCLKFLADAGAVERQAAQVRTVVGADELRSLTDELSDAFLALADGDEARLIQVEEYAVGNKCRAKSLAALLGRPEPEETCGKCDVCAPVSDDETRNDPVIQTRPAKRRAPARRRTGTDDSVQEHDEEFG